MKNAIILHGTAGTPKSYWFPYIKDFLEEKGYEVWVPQLPDSDDPDLKIQLPFVLENGKFDESTIIIGHSSSCALILSLLENINVKIRQAILVSGFYKDLEEGENLKILQKRYNWEKIKSNVKDIIFINSDNDPWGANDKQGRGMFDKLGGTLIIRHGEGHMGSDAFNQPYKKFPFLKKIIDL